MCVEVVDVALMALQEIKANLALTECPYVVTFTDAWFNEGRPHISWHHT